MRFDDEDFREATYQNVNKTNTVNSQAILFLCLALGAILRWWGIAFGLPHFWHPDETHYVYKALVMLKSVDPNPHYFQNPPLITYLFGAALAAQYLLGRIMGTFASPADFSHLWLADPTSMYVICRVLASFFGIGTCLVLYFVAKRLFDGRTGLVACALLSTAFLHVRDSHYAVNDVAATFFLLSAFHFSGQIFVNGGKLRSYLLAGAAAGISVATKYNAGIIIVPLLLAPVLSGGLRKIPWWRLMALLISCAFCFVLFCPWIILDSTAFRDGFISQAALANAPWMGGLDENPYWQFLTTLTWGYGLIPLLMALLSVFALRAQRAKLIFVASFPLVYFAVMGLNRMFFVRLTLPVFPFLALLSACGIIYVAGLVKHEHSHRVVCALTAVAVLQGLVFSMRSDYLIAHEDTRFIARRWIEKNVAPASGIVIEAFGPNLQDFPKAKQFINALRVWPAQKSLPEIGGDFDHLRKSGFDYIVTSSFVRDRAFVAPQQLERIDYYQRLDAQGSELARISPAASKPPFNLDEVYSPFWNLFNVDSAGPEIRIYKL